MGSGRYRSSRTCSLCKRWRTETGGVEWIRNALMSSANVSPPRHRGGTSLKGLGGGILGGAFALAGLGRADAKPAKVGICHHTGNRNIPVVYEEVSASTAATLLARGDTLPGTVTDCSFCGDACTSNDACFTPVCNGGSCGLAPVDPVDCTYSDWSEWSACSAECGGGTQTRTRTIVTGEACGGIPCDGDSLLDQQSCNTGECAGGGQVPLYGECSVDDDCESGQCGCDSPPGFPSCFCREETCLAEGDDCSNGSGAVSCCTGDCISSNGGGTCIANICPTPCPPGENCVNGIICVAYP